jgi:CubicO group peptidase (beta-lactamase class C family)
VTSIDGWVAPGFEAVEKVFQSNFDSGRDVGAAFAAYHHGEKVVDLWGGIANQTTGAPWEKDTLALVYSTTKGMTAMCANKLAQEGRLDMDAPVATYWPEFAQAGKEAVTVNHLLSHRAGLAWVDGTMTEAEMLSWDPVIRALERQAPSWEPGTKHGYHATTFGWLVGEVVRRVTGKTIGAYFRDEITAPLEADAYIGLPPENVPRVARLISLLESLAQGRTLESLTGGSSGNTDLGEVVNAYLGSDGPLLKALMAPGGALANPDLWNSPRLYSAEVPAANGICDARSLARLYGACVSEVSTSTGPVRILGPEQLDRARTQQTEGPDVVLMGLDIQFGLGFMLNKGLINLTGPQSFGHFGMGGSAGWADPHLELGMGYVMNLMELGTTGDTRSLWLIQATAEAARAIS